MKTSSKLARSLLALSIAGCAGKVESEADSEPLDSSTFDSSTIDSGEPDSTTAETGAEDATVADVDALDGDDAAVDAPEESGPDVAIVDGSVAMGWTFRGGPARALRPIEIIASGADLLATNGDRFAWYAGGAWTEADVDFRYEIPSLFARGATSGFIGATKRTIYRLFPSLLDTSVLADCPASGCTDGLAITAAETLLVVDGKTLHRRTKSGAWSKTAFAPAAACSTLTVSGARVTIACGSERWASVDDGVTFELLDASGDAIATTAGVCAVRAGGIGLRSDAGTWTTVLPASGDMRIFGSDSRITAITTSNFAVSGDGCKTWTTGPRWPFVTMSASPSRVFGIDPGGVLWVSVDGTSFTTVELPMSGATPRAFAYRAGTKFVLDDGFVKTFEGTTWKALGEALDAPSMEPHPFEPFLGIAGASGPLLAGGPWLHRWSDTTSTWDSPYATSTGGPPGSRAVTPIAQGGGRLVDAHGAVSIDEGATYPHACSVCSGVAGSGVDSAGNVYVWDAAAVPPSVRKSSDAGMSWTAIAGTPPSSGRFHVAADGTSFFVDAGVLRRYDGAGWPVVASWPRGDMTFLALGAKGTLVLQEPIAKTGHPDVFRVLVSDDGGSTFVDRTYELERAALAFASGNGHVWALLAGSGIFELVPK